MTTCYRLFWPAILLLGSLLSFSAVGQRRTPATPAPTMAPAPAPVADTLKTGLVTRPTIMVFPFFKEGQSLRKVVEDDPYNRVVMAKVREAFDQRGYPTIDFLGKIRALNVTEVLTANTKTDLKTQIIGSSGADIAIEVEYRAVENGSGNEVSIILNAYETSTAASLANKVGSSGKFYSQDWAKLISRAIDPVLDEFMGNLQRQFTDIVANGRYLSLEVGIAETSDLKMTTEIGTDGLALSDVLEEWATQNTKSYHIQGVSDLKTIFDVIRVPRTDAQNRPLTTTRYALDLLKFCNSLTVSRKPGQKLRASRTVKGNTILITLN